MFFRAILSLGPVARIIVSTITGGERRYSALEPHKTGRRVAFPSSGVPLGPTTFAWMSGFLSTLYLPNQRRSDKIVR
ncbi:hypothetical protein K438DRAFT_1835408 [Mycena galopus ATCC 62051]|nr:hypothetical protein K438DRAFT_1835408 [Mycena galopus ATCC 62051]